MAAGITQPGGAGTNILLEDQSNADANLDGISGSYSFNDVGLKALPSGDYINNGTAQKSYRSKASIVNGDGSGTAVTTIKDSNFNLFFDAAKSLSISTTGRANRYIELGTKVSGIKDSGKDLWKIVAGGSLALLGNIKLYGGQLQALSGTITLAPAPDATVGEIINCLIQSPGSVSLGTGSAPCQTIYNADLIVGAGTNNAVLNMCADYCERVTVALAGSGTNIRFINTSSRLAARDLVFIGTPTSECLRYVAAVEGFLVEPTWAQTVPAVTQNVAAILGEWWRFEPLAVDEVTAAPLSGCLVQVYGQHSGLMLSDVTDSLGRLSYNVGGLTITQNCLRARYILDSTSTWLEEWPLTIVLNSDGAMGPNYEAGRTYLATWPHTTYLAGAQKQLEPFQGSLGLRPFIRPGWLEQSVDA